MIPMKGTKGPVAMITIARRAGASSTPRKTPSAHLAAFGHDRVSIQLLHAASRAGFRARPEIRIAKTRVVHGMSQTSNPTSSVNRVISSLFRPSIGDAPPATRLASVPLIVDMLVALITTKLPLLFGAGLEPVSAMPKIGFWAFAYQARLA
jgi:hypothetical protein